MAQLYIFLLLYVNLKKNAILSNLDVDRRSDNQ